MTDFSQALPYVVERKSFAKFFEPIAAFNDKRIADGYADDCRTCNQSFEYRVTSHYEGV